MSFFKMDIGISKYWWEGREGTERGEPQIQERESILGRPGAPEFGDHRIHIALLGFSCQEEASQ